MDCSKDEFLSQAESRTENEIRDSKEERTKSLQAEELGREGLVMMVTGLGALLTRTSSRRGERERERRRKGKEAVRSEADGLIGRE